MRSKKIIINGTGCALADYLYNGISFNSPGFRKYLSLSPGDGGLTPGRLVFTEELEIFGGHPYSQILSDITGNRQPETFNVGGPSLVSLIHASQMLDKEEFEVRFFGMAGKDETASRIFKIVEKTPLNTGNYLAKGSKATPFTDVFSDPSYDNGHGERTFVNNIGSAWEYTPQMPGREFFNASIVCFGGTALVPQIHDNLTELLAEAKRNNCITLVNTVFDFRNEKNNPGKPWPLGNSQKSFQLTDILIMDLEEAIHISGCKTGEEASMYFRSSGVGSFIITNGAKPVLMWSSGRLFNKHELCSMPVSKRVGEMIKSDPSIKGDTTGCGDNFAGGVLASLALQIKGKSVPDLAEAVSWGIASGGFCCFYMGGTYIEKQSGEKFDKIKELQSHYFKDMVQDGNY